MPDPTEPVSPTKHQELEGYSDPNFSIVSGSTDAGVFASSSEPGQGTQAGVQAQASSVAGHATIGDVLGSPKPSENPGFFESALNWMFGTPKPVEPGTTPQGGWQNVVSAEAHGPSASGDASIGDAGAKAQVGGEAVGASVTIGGAEYNKLGGTEVTIGAGLGVGGGVTTSWSDDDGDGVRELGISGSFMEVEGANVGFKTEVAGHADNYLGPKVLAGGDAVLEGVNSLVPKDPGLQPTTPAPADPLHPTEIGFGP